MKALRITPNRNMSGTAVITVIVADAGGLTVTTSFAVTVLPRKK